MAKISPPSPPFIPARFRGGKQTPKAIVMHATVSSDNKGTARDIANWWAGPTSPKSSAHYTVDPGEVIQSVGDHTVAFHCGFNQNSIGVEMCDEQVGPADRWQDADSTAIIRRAARLVARLCLAYDIEPIRPTIAELKRRGPHGIYGHNDSRLAFGSTTHTDPRDFPWPMFMRLVRKEVRRLRATLVEPQAAPDAGPKPFRVHVMQASMLYSLSLKRKEADLEKIFSRAARRDVAWVTGTEYPDDPSRELLKKVAGSYGYRTFFRGRDDVWIAVQRDFIAGNVEVAHEVVIPKEEGFGKKGPRGLLTVTFDSVPELGRVTVAAAHLLTKGRPDGEGLWRTNLVLNQKFTRHIGETAKDLGAGSALFFYGGDQNIVDRTNDTFLGQPLTSAWDELDKWQNTGHGNIDLVASYDKDGRVEAAYCRALDDGELHLNGDHFLVEAGFDVKKA
jgi:hypothetical protein